MGKQKILSLVAAILAGLVLVPTFFSGFYNLRYGSGIIVGGIFFALFLWGAFSSEKHAKEINKWAGLGLILAAIVGVLGSLSILRIGVYFSIIYFPLGIVCSIFGFFVGIKEKNKVYKPVKTQSSMKIHYLFYLVGIIFIFASVWYFAREFIDELPDFIKLVLLIVSIIIAFIIAEVLRGRDL